jgi:hypothetical protein
MPPEHGDTDARVNSGGGAKRGGRPLRGEFSRRAGDSPWCSREYGS